MKTMYQYSFLTGKITPVEVIEDSPFVKLADGTVHNKTSTTRGFANSYAEAHKALVDDVNYRIIMHEMAGKELQQRIEQIAQIAPSK